MNEHLDSLNPDLPWCNKCEKNTPFHIVKKGSQDVTVFYHCNNCLNDRMFIPSLQKKALRDYVIFSTAFMLLAIVSSSYLFKRYGFDVGWLIFIWPVGFFLLIVMPFFLGARRSYWNWHDWVESNERRQAKCKSNPPKGLDG